MVGIHSYREGNFIEYMGLGGQQNARIIKINPGEEAGSFILETIYNPPKVFLTLEKEIQPIYFRDYHVKQIGFVFDEKTKRNELNGLCIAYYGGMEGCDPIQLRGKFTNYYI